MCPGLWSAVSCNEAVLRPKTLNQDSTQLKGKGKFDSLASRSAREFFRSVAAVSLRTL